MNPQISVRAFAEMINLPAHAQLRILAEQKYPDKGAPVFRIPFYQPSLQGIRNYYNSGNNIKVLGVARQKIKLIGHNPKRNNNLRALNAFITSKQSSRNLTLLKQDTLIAQPVSGMELRLVFDIAASETGSDIRIFYNFRSDAADKAVARRTLEIAHWIMTQNGVGVPFSALEYVDFSASKVYKVKQLSATTKRLLTVNARVIASLWPTI